MYTHFTHFILMSTKCYSFVQETGCQISQNSLSFIDRFKKHMSFWTHLIQIIKELENSENARANEESHLSSNITWKHTHTHTHIALSWCHHTLYNVVQNICTTALTFVLHQFTLNKEDDILVMGVWCGTTRQPSTATPEVHCFSLTECPGVCYSTHTTAICQRLQCLIY